jgi:hypothetical protein
VEILLTHLSDVGPASILVVVVLMVLTGRLVPGREARYWRQAFFAEQKKNATLTLTAEVTRDFFSDLDEQVKARAVSRRRDLMSEFGDTFRGDPL